MLSRSRRGEVNRLTPGGTAERRSASPSAVNGPVASVGRPGGACRPEASVMAPK